ncbi:DoxX family protein [Azotosporobacter soli]|uniref:DoxX family protein n=1 Tax=Azotosporobacter soli TaxID=3055040 RepID=UPI0031FEE24A
MKKNYEWSMLLIRLALGSIFLAHGLQKISGFEGIVQWFASIGLPPALAYAVTAIETLGGAGLLFGVLVRLSALGIAGVIVGAILSVKLSKGFIGGYEFDLLILAAALALVLSGSDKFALGNLFGRSSRDD